MPRCILINLRELYLYFVTFQHEPTELTNIPCLSTLVLQWVSGIPDYLYKQLTCRLTLPSLEEIDICNGGGLHYALANYKCVCSEPCIYNLSWLGCVCLSWASDVTSDILSCLGVNREHHDGIINTVNNMADDGRRYYCYITGKFNIVSKLCVNIRLFRALLAYLPTTHVRQLRLGDITDANVNMIRDMLTNVIYDELVIRR